MPSNPVIFAVGAQGYRLGQVLAAAQFRGEGAALRRQIREGLACQSYAADERYSMGEKELQAASESFRRRRELFTAEETERWLGDRGVTADDLGEFLARQHWRRRFAGQMEEILSQYAEDPVAGAAALWPELVFSDLLEPLALPLAQRVAAATELGLRRSPEEWLAALPDLEETFLAATAAQLTDDRYRQELNANRLDLVRVEFEAATAPDADLVRELACSVRLDGGSFAEAGANAIVRTWTATAFFRDLPEEFSWLFISARAGETLGPIEADGASTVFRLLSKREPELSDPEIRDTLRQRILSAYLGRLMDRHIAWGVSRR